MMPANTAPELDLTSPDRRNRLTVGFRSLLVIPQTIAVTALGLIASAAIFVGWFAALATGRIPTWAWTFTAQVTAYQARVSAYQYLLVDEYPPFAFTAPDVTNYPVQLDLPEQGRLSRVKVLFRIILAIPATIVITALNWGWIACGFFIWLAVLITGRTPKPVFDAVSAMLRYQLRYNAWLNLLTDKRPKELFGDKDPAAERPEPVPECASGPAGIGDHHPELADEPANRPNAARRLGDHRDNPPSVVVGTRFLAGPRDLPRRERRARRGVRCGECGDCTRAPT